LQKVQSKHHITR